MNLMNFNLSIFIAVCVMAMALSRMKALENKYLRWFYLFAAGNLIAIVSFDILPHSIGEIGFLGVTIFLMIGCIIFELMHEYLELFSTGEKNTTHITIGAALMSHGLPEGMALGVAMGTSNTQNYWSILVVFILHILPEMIMFQQAMKENKNIKALNLIMLSIIVFIPAIAGILISVAFGGKVSGAVGILSAAAAGFICMLVVKELIFRNNKQLKIEESLIIILGSAIVAVILL